MIARGIDAHRNGTLRAFVRVHRKLYTKVFPAGTPIGQIKEWRERTRARAKFGDAVAPTVTTFADDAETHLSLIHAMPTYKDAKYRIGQWVTVFGGRDRADIQPAEIRAVLERWRKAGMSAGTLNLRRTALMSLYTALDGKSGRNPVKDVPRYDERDSADIIRSHPIRAWYRWLARIGRQGKGGARVNRGELTRTRLRVLLWTGWPHRLLAQIDRTSVDWEQGRVRLPRRKKGSGTAGGWLPVVPPAVVALKALDALDGWGEFDGASMSHSLKRAWKRENAWRVAHGHQPLPRPRSLDARHTFGAWLAANIADQHVIDRLMMSKQRRYREGSMEQRLIAARDTLAEKLARTNKPGRVLTMKARA